MKTCTNCNVNKDHSDFYSNGGKCKACVLKRYKEFRDKEPEKYRNSVTRSRLKRKFGITVEDFDGLLVKQNNVCAICQGPQNGKRMYQLCVDHCHNTGKIRGLLCNDCNVGLGRFKDNITSLNNAITYLT